MNCHNYNFSEVWTVNDLIKELYIGENTAYKLLNSGEIKAFKIGHNWKIPKESVEEYILHKCRKGTE